MPFLYSNQTDFAIYPHTVTVTLINSFSGKAGSYMGYFFNAGKMCGILLIVSFGVYGFASGRTEAFASPFEGSSLNPTRYGIAFVAGYFSYAGWQSLGNIAGEIKNPNRTLPLSIFLSLAACMAIYLATNVAFFAFLTAREVTNSNVVAFTFLERVIGDWSWIMSICVCLSTLGLFCFYTGCL